MGYNFHLKESPEPEAGQEAEDGLCLDRQTRLWISIQPAMYVVTAAWGWGHSRPFHLSLKK